LLTFRTIILSLNSSRKFATKLTLTIDAGGKKRQKNYKQKNVGHQIVFISVFIGVTSFQNKPITNLRISCSSFIYILIYIMRMRDYKELENCVWFENVIRSYWIQVDHWINMKWSILPAIVYLMSIGSSFGARKVRYEKER